MERDYWKQAKRWLPLLLVAGLASCAREPSGVIPVDDPPGFLFGLLHGFGIVFAFIGTFFVEEMAIYAVPNTGWPYNLGFIIGIAFFFGLGGAGSSGARKT